MRINYLAVAVSALAYWALGALWYSPLLFARPFITLMRWTPEDYWLLVTGEGGPGIDGGLYRRHEGMSFNAHVNTIDVPSVENYLARVEAAGGKAVTKKITLPGVGYLAYCQDTEGNTFGIMQADAKASA